MSKQRSFFIALATCTAAVPLVASGSHDGTEPFGYGCGMYSAGNYEARYGSFENGHLWAGPVSGTPPTGEAAQNMMVRCSVQIGSPLPEAPDVASAEANGSGGTVVLGPHAFSYHAPDQQDVFLCTEYTWTTAGGQQYHHYDADGDPNNGAQCQLTTEVNNGTVRTHVALPDGNLCATVVVPNLPPQEQCIPYGDPLPPAQL